MVSDAAIFDYFVGFFYYRVSNSFFTVSSNS